MRKTVLKFLLGFVLISEACAGLTPQVAGVDPSGLDPNAIETAIAGTMAVAATQTAQIVALSKTPSPTATLTPTLSPTTFPTFTVVVAASLVYVTKSTFCRAGPGEVYKSLGALKAGEAAAIVGRSADAKYWIIRNPKQPKQLCWLSGKYASVTGVVGALPVFTAPPKPTRTPRPPTHTPKPATPKLTPSFAAVYTDTINCTGAQWFVQVELTNNGKVPFESVYVHMEDTTTLEVFSLQTETFTNSNGCADESADTLPVKGVHKISMPPLTYDPVGRQLSIGISLCSKPALGGVCAVQILTVTPP